MIIRLHWWKEFRRDGFQNYGDLMSKYLVEKISGKKVFSTRSKYNKYYKHISEKFYIVIGSIIGAANKNAIVWGSGIISKDQDVGHAKFLAVRGPRTRNRLKKLGYEVPEIYGDPAILLPLLIKDDQEKIFKVGIIPHFVDYHSIINNLPNNQNLKVINLLTNSIEKTTKEILQCEMILSSSLHGVIVGHAYRIPSLWIKFSDKLSGDDIKFYDYFESMSIEIKDVITMLPNNLDEVTINELFIKYGKVALQKDDMLKKRQNQLMESCPFKK